MEDARRRDIALFRYALIRQAAHETLTKAERGRLVRDLAGRDHVGPGGERVRVGRSRIDKWIVAYRTGGFDALIPPPATPPAPTASRRRRLAALKPRR